MVLNLGIHPERVLYRERHPLDSENFTNTSRNLGNGAKLNVSYTSH